MARRHAWRWFRLVLLVIAAVLAFGVRRARADDGGTTPDPTTLVASDFAFGLAWTDASGAQTALDENGIQSFFSRARCICPTTVEVDVALGDAAPDKIGSDTLDVTLVVGTSCDNPSATGCVTVGSALALSAQQTVAATTFSSGDLYAAAAAGACSTLTSTSTRLWAIVSDAGTRLGAAPSLSISLGAGPPSPPTATSTLTADGALQVSWTASATATVTGYQVLCAPALSSPPAPAYDSCEAAAVAGIGVSTAVDGGTDAGASPFATLDPAALCSGLVSAPSSSVRISGLTNGQTYQVAVIAIGGDGTPSAPSVVTTGLPGPTFGIQDLYHQAGGEAQGCAIGGGGDDFVRPGLALALAAALAGFLGFGRRARRRRGLSALAPLVLVALAARPAWAQQESPPESLQESRQETDDIAALFARGAPKGPSPIHWNLELRFGAYRPDVDSEFEARGVSARPYTELFGTGRHLMAGFELDRQLLSRHGTLAVGLGLSMFRVSAASLAADMQTRTGDETALRLIPLSASLIYRASMLAERTKLPLAPYAKLGLDCTFWSMSETSRSSSTDGVSYGWHAAAGIALLLDVVDPEGARDLDDETGINHTSAFFEVAYVGTGLGFGGPQLQVGDTTWLGGLMLEM